MSTSLRLESAEVAEIRALIERVTDHDGVRPLSEHVWLHIKPGGHDHGLHLLARRSDATLAAYAHLDTTDSVDGPSIELAVDPADRRSGIGRSIINEFSSHTHDGRLRLWAHGEHAGAAELATGMGFQRSRSLWQMRRSLYSPLPEAVLPPDVSVRPFRVGRDEAAWLDLNSRAFAELPDQGRWTATDLDLRLNEPWFSADGFLVAWRGADMIGFHWTKVHGRADAHEHHHQLIGEVYVVGVDPSLRGEGLGRALTIVGLRHLRSLDLGQVLLYVDSTNAAAITLYESLGFAKWDSDVLFIRIRE
jgi:mycothiol synthase